MAIRGLSPLRKEIEGLKKQMAKTAKEGFKRSFETIFKKMPQVQAIRWRQYTPYFNDGCPCTFRVDGAAVKIDDESGDDEDGFMGAYDFDSETPERKLIDDLDSDLEACEDALLVLFGDHVEVTIFRDSPDAQVEAYDHE